MAAYQKMLELINDPATEIRDNVDHIVYNRVAHRQIAVLDLKKNQIDLFEAGERSACFVISRMVKLACLRKMIEDTM